MKSQNDILFNQISDLIKEQTKIICNHIDEKFNDIKDCNDYKERLRQWNKDLLNFTLDHKVYSSAS